MVRKLVAAGELTRLKIGSCARFEPGDVDAYLHRLRGTDRRPKVPITEGQLRAFHAKASALDREHGLDRGTSKEEALERATVMLGRLVSSPSELSSREANRVLDYLDDQLGRVTV